MLLSQTLTYRFACLKAIQCDSIHEIHSAAVVYNHTNLYIFIQYCNENYRSLLLFSLLTTDSILQIYNNIRGCLRIIEALQNPVRLDWRMKMRPWGWGCEDVRIWGPGRNPEVLNCINIHSVIIKSYWFKTYILPPSSQSDVWFMFALKGTLKCVWHELHRILMGVFQLDWLLHFLTAASAESKN